MNTRLKSFMKTFILLIMLLFPLSAWAYVGPGAGVGTITVVLGVIASVFLAIVGIFWYPLKRFIKKLKGSGNNQDNAGK